MVRSSDREPPDGHDRSPIVMPLLIVLILIILIAQIGFWDTLSAVLGGVLMVVLFLAILAAFVAAASMYAYRRVRRRFR